MRLFSFFAASTSTSALESAMEVLVEELMDLHSSSPTFRQLFESHATTQIFVESYRSFVSKCASLDLNQRIVRILEKLGHFGLALALDNAVAGSQKREVYFYPDHSLITLSPWAFRS
jgi:hypothetical protein